jgi:DNA-binding MarR family transcriptional regulator
MSDLKAIFSELVRFQTELWNAVDDRLRTDFDLPLSRFEPMQVIARQPSCRVFDIATQLSITVGGTSKLVDRIEESGYCVRRNNPDDRRSSLIELTLAGRQVLERATVSFEDELKIRLGAASGRTLDQLGETLTRLRASMNDAVDSESASA